MQFQKDDVVLYGVNGACLVQDVEHRDNGDYYVLTPVHKDNTKLLVPLDNKTLVSRMRPVPSADSMTTCIRRAARSDAKWINDASKRKEAAKKAISTGDEFNMLVLERQFYERRRDAQSSGARYTASDNHILRVLKSHIDDELSVVFGIEQEDVSSYVERAAATA